MDTLQRISSYYVKRSLSNGGPYTVIGNPANGVYDDLTAVNGTTYYYVVSAINITGESGNSNQVIGIPNPQPSSTTLSSTPLATGAYGEEVTFTATVTVSSGPATGTVTFRDGGTIIGTGTLSAGEATLATSTLAVGNHSIAATYEGDSTFISSVSAPYAYLVTPKTLTISGVTATGKPYDGTTVAFLTGGTLSAGAIGGETVNIVPGTGTFANPNVGTWAVTASGYSLGGTHAGNYQLSAQPTVPNATISPLPLQLSGTRIYDGTNQADAAALTISNKVPADDLTLTGSAPLAGKDAGTQPMVFSSSTPTRVRSATGFSSGTSSTSFTVTMSAAPANGNTLVAVVSTRGTTADRVTGITSTGAVWSRAAQSTNGSGSTTEIWHAPVTSGAAAAVTISTAAGRCAGVVVEYSGILAANALDQIAASPGATSVSPLTGTTPVTTQANELWIGGIGYRSSAPTLGSLLNSFASVAFAQSNNGTASNNAKVHALERIVNTTGTASTGGTLSASVIWSGAIATFKAATNNSLALSGPAAGNYTLTGMTGSVAITPKNLTTSGLSAASRNYDGTNTATLTGTAALLPTQAPGTGTTSDGRPYTGDDLSLAGAATGSFADKHAANNKPVTVTGLTLGGLQAANYAFVPPAGLTANVSILPLTLSAVNATKTYDGTTTAAGTPMLTPSLVSGDSTTVLTQSFENATAGTANKVITPSITINDGNSGANYQVTPVNFNSGTIHKATATVTLGSLSHTYNGSTKSATAVTDPTGMLVNFTYDGSPTLPTAIGNYAVIATVTDSNYTGTANGTLAIAAQSIADWKTAHFTAGEITAGLADHSTDADGDGFTNDEEYVLGTNPRAFSEQPLVIAPAVGGQFTLSFTARRATGAGYAGHTRSYTVESTADPAVSWQPVTGYTNLVGAAGTSAITGDDQNVVVTMPLAYPARFFRLNARLD